MAFLLDLWAYASNASLWLDEILLSRNILALPLPELLTQPLRLDQVAPRGFLLLEKLAVLALGENELALRLFPFLCGVAGIFLFRRLAEQTLGGWAAIVALVLFTISVPFVRYAAQVKQYVFDATVTTILLLLALHVRRRDLPTRRLALIGAAAFVAIWFSQASVVVMAGVGLALAIDWLMSRERRVWRALTVTISLWAVASMVAVVAGTRSMTPSTREFMNDFWRDGFMPTPIRPTSSLAWLWQQLVSVFGDPTLFRYRWPAAFVVLWLAGLIYLWRERREVALLLLGPLVMAVVAAALHQYPFRGRLVFYYAPAVLIALGAATGWLRRLASWAHSALGAATVVAVLVAPLMAFRADPPPYEVEHTRAVLGFLQRNRQPGDAIHVFPLSRIGVLFYGPRYGLQLGDWTTSVCDRNDTRAYVRDVDRYRGRPRVWLLSARARPFRTAHPAVQQYLGTIGVRRDSLVVRSTTMGSVSLDLYDLSDSTRLRAADAETFPVQPMPTDPRPGCRPWARPSPVDSFR